MTEKSKEREEVPTKSIIDEYGIVLPPETKVLRFPTGGKYVYCVMLNNTANPPPDGA